MQPFDYVRPTSLAEAFAALGRPGSMAIAGGTNMVDLMRGGVLAPSSLVDLSGLGEMRTVSTEGAMLRFGALVPMAEAAENATLLADYPALAQSLQLASSQQLRNVATLGGNLLQRTRCPYYRDHVSPCNKRHPGMGCAALDGHNREHAVLGGSGACVATYPGDWGCALAAFDTELELSSADGDRVVPLPAFFREPGDTPDVETALRPGEIIIAIRVAKTPAGRRSTYLKVRDRQSYAFAIASAAVALRLDSDIVGEARIALGGVATRPWRSEPAEAQLVGRRLSAAAAREAGAAAFDEARALDMNGVKLRLGRRVVAEAIRVAGGKEGAAWEA